MKHTIFHSIDFASEAASYNFKYRENTVVIDSIYFDPDNQYKFTECDRDTELIVFQIFGNPSFDIQSLFNYASFGITVFQKMKEDFYINPYLIVLTTESIEQPVSASISERFDLIDCRCNRLFNFLINSFQP